MNLVSNDFRCERCGNPKHTRFVRYYKGFVRQCQRCLDDEPPEDAPVEEISLSEYKRWRTLELLRILKIKNAIKKLILEKGCDLEDVRFGIEACFNELTVQQVMES